MQLCRRRTCCSPACIEGRCHPPRALCDSSSGRFSRLCALSRGKYFSIHVLRTEQVLLLFLPRHLLSSSSGSFIPHSIGLVWSHTHIYIYVYIYIYKYALYSLGPLNISFDFIIRLPPIAFQCSSCDHILICYCHRFLFWALWLVHTYLWRPESIPASPQASHLLAFYQIPLLPPWICSILWLWSMDVLWHATLAAVIPSVWPLLRLWHT